MQTRLAAWVLLLLATPSFADADKRADEIVQQADYGRGLEGAFSVVVTVKDDQNGDIKESVYRVASKGVRFSLVEQTGPARLQGRKLLMRDHDLWLYTPNIKRPTRVSFEQRLTGEVSNGDLMRTNFAEDYSATLLGEEKIDGAPAYKLDLQARHKSVTYRRIVYWVEKGRLLPLKAEFYAISGKLLKTATYSEFKNIQGKPRMTLAVIRDAIQSGRVSRIHYSRHKNENLNDAYFSKESLEE